jgi:hypothetical protein
MQAERIISESIKKYSRSNKKKDKMSKQLKHTILGMIYMSVKLGELSLEDAEKYVDEVFEAYGAME